MARSHLGWFKGVEAGREGKRGWMRFRELNTQGMRKMDKTKAMVPVR